MEVVTNVVQYTDVSTSTVTAGAYFKHKRDAPAPTPAANAAWSGETAGFGQATQDWNPEMIAAWAPEISSACKCLNLGPTYTSTVTSTGDASVSSAWDDMFHLADDAVDHHPEWVYS